MLTEKDKITFPDPVRPTIPMRSPDWIVNERSCKTFGPSGEYLADRFSTRSCPLVGQDAGGSRTFDGFSSWSTSRYDWIRSRLIWKGKCNGSTCREMMYLLPER